MSNFDTENSVYVGSYTVVGMIASELMVFGSTAYMEYDELITISDEIHDESITKVSQLFTLQLIKKKI